MRIAAFNVENLFDRIRAFNDVDPDLHRDILDWHSELNKLFEKDSYSDADKEQMIILMDNLGILRDNEGPYVYLRKIRGKIITRPRNGSPKIVAKGRESWVGWCELKTAQVEERAIVMTAKVIRDLAPDILAVVEVESRPVLSDFYKFIYRKIAPDHFRHLMVIDGNDKRGIDVGLMARDGFVIPSIRSHVDERTEQGRTVFSRDCPEYILTTPGGNTIAILPNHFKSKYGGNSPRSREKRRLQAQFTASYYQRLLDEGVENIVVLGDLNDTPDSAELAPLLSTSLQEVTDHPAFTEFQFDANRPDRGIGTFGTGADSKKIDYILLSPALWDKVTLGGIFRKGCWTGSDRWDMYDDLTKERYAASDHHALWVDLDLE